MLKKEGLESPNQPTSASSSAPSTSAPSSSSSASHLPSTAIRPSNPDQIFAAQEDIFTRAPAQRPKKEKRKRDDSSSSDPSSSNLDEPDFKKRRLTPAELAALRLEKKRAWEQKQKDIVTQQEKRREKHTLLTQKTSKGQPVLANQMEMLLEKLQKKAAAKANPSSSTASSSTASSSASASIKK